MKQIHSIIITGKVQDISFRSIIENIGRSFRMPGIVFNAKNGSVNILCSYDHSIDDFTKIIRERGIENGVEIVDVMDEILPVNIALPDNFSKVSSDDELDIGRKLDKANLLLKSGFDTMNSTMDVGFDNMNSTMTAGFDTMNSMMSNMNRDLNTGFDKLTNMLGSFISEQQIYNREQQIYNRGQQEHNNRLEKILEKIADK